MSSSISRIQLAAVLREYDNDPANPAQPKISHRDSAIFLPFKSPINYLPPTSSTTSRGTPSPTNNHASAQPRPENRRRRTSGLSNWSVRVDDIPELSEGDLSDPRESGPDDNRGEEGQEVDLSRWDLPEHLIASELSPKENGTVKTREVISPVPVSVSAVVNGKGKARSVHLDIIGYNQEEEQLLTDEDRRSTVQHHERFGSRDHRQSVYGGLRQQDNGRRDSTETTRPRSSTTSTIRPEGRQRRSSDPRMIPLPESPSHTYRPFSSLSMNRPASRRRSFDVDHLGSSAVSGFQEVGLRVEEEEEINPFAMPPPPVELGSRFDPKLLSSQRRSLTLDRPGSQLSMSVSEYPYTTGRPLSRLDTNLPRSHGRQESLDTTLSSPLTSLSTHQFLSSMSPQSSHIPNSPSQIPHLDNGRLSEVGGRTYETLPTAEEYGHQLVPSKYTHSRQIDRGTLMRPKVLIMPTPLAGTDEAGVKQKKGREGSVYGEKPLPTGARSSILVPLTTYGEIGDGDGSGGGDWSGDISTGVGEGGRPGMRESFSFRSSRGFQDYTGEEGDISLNYVYAEGERRPGKLFGTSLIDQLEARKQAMRSKQRVFTGDSRPAMMARSSSQPLLETSTSNSTSPYPDSQSHTYPPVPSSRSIPRLSMNTDPSISYDNSFSASESTDKVQNQGNTSRRPTDRLTKSRSVFGVDEIWEREMAKLSIIQEKERMAEAAAAEKASMKMSKRTKKGLSFLSLSKSFVENPDVEVFRRPEDHEVSHSLSVPSLGMSEGRMGADTSPILRISNLPPQLNFSPEKLAPRIVSSNTSATKGGPHGKERIGRKSRGTRGGWRGSSDESSLSEEELGSISGVGGRRASAAQKGKGRAVGERPLARSGGGASSLGSATQDQEEDDEDDDDDVPLSAIIRRLPPSQSARFSVGPPTSLRSLSLSANPGNVGGPDSEDDDIPLSRLVLYNDPTIRTVQRKTESETDEDIPLSKIKLGDVGTAGEKLPKIELDVGADSGLLGLVLPSSEGLSVDSTPNSATTDPSQPAAIASSGVDDSTQLNSDNNGTDEDDIPLYLLKAKAAKPTIPENIDDDDIPLAFRPQSFAFQERARLQQQQQMFHQYQEQIRHSVSFVPPQNEYLQLGAFANPYVSMGMPGMPMMQGVHPLMGMPMQIPLPMGMGMQPPPGYHMGMGMPPNQMVSPLHGPQVRIDDWRKQVPLIPNPTGLAISGQSSGGSRVSAG